MTKVFTSHWTVWGIILGLVALVAYLATAIPGRSQVPDATVALGSAEAVTSSEATIELWLTPQPGITVGALHVVVTYDDTLVSAASCYNISYGSSGCNTSFGPSQVGFAWISYPGGISGLVGTVTFQTLAVEGTANLDVTITTCADGQGLDLTCTGQGGEIAITTSTPTPVPTPTPTPSPTPTPPPPTASPTPVQPPRKWGDVNCDGNVNAVDALALLREVAGLPVFQVAPCPTIGAVYPQPIGGK